MGKIEFLGIDLGTSNSAVSYFQDGSLTTAEIDQIDSPNTRVKKQTLASCMYIPRQGEFNSALSENPVVGEFANAVIVHQPKSIRKTIDVGTATHFVGQQTILGVDLHNFLSIFH